MTKSIEQHLLSRDTNFSLAITNTSDPMKWVRSQLLGSPAALSTLGSIAAGAMKGLRSWTISFSVGYRSGSTNVPTFLVRDRFEYRCALSTAIKMKLRRLSIVIDNAADFIDPQEAPKFADNEFKHIGQELFFFQQDGYQVATHILPSLSIIIFDITFSCFDSPKEMNDLSCYLAEQAFIIRKKSANDRELLTNLANWMKENVKYEDTGETADHSAVGLVRNGTAVCQGIAAAADQIFKFCGIDSRLVRGWGAGIGKWEPHGWNMVKIDGKWEHVDYTMALDIPKFMQSKTIIQPKALFDTMHKYDEEDYSPKNSDIIVATDRTLDGSVLSLIPDSVCCAINGAIMDTTFTHKMCITKGSSFLVSILDVISMFDGAYFLDSKENVNVYLGTKKYEFSASELIDVNGIMYLPAEKSVYAGIDMDVDGKTITLRRQER